MATSNGNDFPATLYYLGPGRLGFIIIEHNRHDSEHCGGVCFTIDEYGISDGDGIPSTYDDTFIQISETDYHHVMDLFRKAGDTMCEPGEKSGKPFDRPVSPGDYLYSYGDYIHIDSITPEGGYRGEYFSYDYYYMVVYMDTDDLTDDELEFDNPDYEYILITEDSFNDALSIIRTAQAEITKYLEELYKAGNKTN